MVPSLKISQSVINKLPKIREPTYAKLLGVFYENTTILLAVEIESKSTNILEYSLPTEIDLYGIVSVSNEKSNHSNIVPKLREQIDVTDNPIFLSYCLSKINVIEAYILINDQLQTCSFTIVPEHELYEHLLYVRLTGHFPITCNAERAAYDEMVLNLRKAVTSGNLAFHFPKTPIYLLGMENETENSIAGEIVGTICENTSENETIGKKKRNLCTLDAPPVLDCVIFRKATKDHLSSNEKDHAPICFVNKQQKHTVQIPITIDVLSLISKQTSLNTLYNILVESIVKSLKAFHLTILKNLTLEDRPILPEVYHFYPNGCGHFVTIWIPKNANQTSLESSRRALHEQFLLPTNRPLFRRENKYSFKELIEGGPLINPHLSLKNTKNEGKIALVKGKYSYYHYNQNRMNDSGWGCAYRSLQTLASWFKWQGFTDREVPTFEEIQKCLVDIGDKPSNFMGSNQWIGSMEVSFVLDTLLGITCRIVNVSNGAEMAYEGPELVRHFEEYGSPIMIGGGNLAHTILGVDYNETTGSIKYLILDPHYIGPEDLQVIQSKGWCGWKGVEFWNKNSYYNMCLPIVPSGV